ncbi:MAG: AI-2E family transporter [Gammaproteobacteria bacterium]|nr:AI-2E family transporter [Gammaproteobacteria bacterium]
MAQDTQTPAPAGHGPGAVAFDRRMLFLVFFFVVFSLLLYQFVRIISPFASPLVGATILALIFSPVHARIATRMKNESAAAGVTTIIVLLTIVVPVVILVWLLISETITAVPTVRDWLSDHHDLASVSASLHLPAPIQRLWDSVAGYIERWQVDLRSTAVEALREIGNKVTSFGAAAVTQFFVFIMNLIVLMLTLFFLLRDGKRIVQWVMDLVPMEEANKRMILGRLDRTLSAIIRGAFITAAAQGTLTGTGLAVAGVPFAVMLGFTAALFSVVPIVGCSLVWLPAAGYLLIKGKIVAGIGLIVWGVAVVGTVDNFIRPYVVGGHAQLPILLLLVGILGGIRVYGLIGALIAPLVIASVLAFAQIYREQYLSGRQEGATDTPAPS